MPISAPLARGILANSFVTVDESVDHAAIESLFRSYYEGSAFVRLLGAGPRHAEVVAIKGSMWADLSWTLGEPFGGKRQLVVTSAIDNLVKGGAGQAVQSMNLVLGLDERSGIDAPAMWP